MLLAVTHEEPAANGSGTETKGSEGEAMVKPRPHVGNVIFWALLKARI